MFFVVSQMEQSHHLTVLTVNLYMYNLYIVLGLKGAISTVAKYQLDVEKMTSK